MARSKGFTLRHTSAMIGRALVTLASLALITKYFLIPDLTKNKSNLHHLIHIDVPFLLLGAGLEISSLIAYAKLTQAVLPGRSVRFNRLLRIDMSTFAVSHLLPGGTVAGTALGYRLLDDQGVSYTDATFALGVQGIGSALVLNVIFWIALVVSVPLHGLSRTSSDLYKFAAIVGAVLLLLAGTLIFFLTIGQRRAKSLISWLGYRIPFVNAVTFESIFQQLSDHLADLAKDRKLLLKAIFWACANWGLDAGSLWIFLRAFGTSVLLPYLLVAYGMAYVLAALPITPGGLGIVEGTMIAILQGFGFHNAALGVLSYRVINFLLPIPVGGICYLSLTVHKASKALSPSDKELPKSRLARSKQLVHITGEIKEELRHAVEIAKTESKGGPPQHH